MLTIIHVHVHVKAEALEAFKTATLDNARNSVKEAGCKRFDVVQELDDPTRFVLVEVYEGDGHAAHRETDHYKRWRSTVEPMMASPRTAKKFSSVHGI